jgi:hypothetical protein
MEEKGSAIGITVSGSLLAGETKLIQTGVSEPVTVSGPDKENAANQTD